MIRGRASDAVLRELLLDGGTGSSLIEENCQGCDESEGPRPRQPNQKYAASGLGDRGRGIRRGTYLAILPFGRPCLTPHGSHGSIAIVPRRFPARDHAPEGRRAVFARRGFFTWQTDERHSQ